MASAFLLHLAVALLTGSESLKATCDRIITPEIVKPIVVELSADSYEGRGGGYGGEKRAAEYIAREYRKLGLQPMGDVVGGKRTFLQHFSFMPHAPTKPWEHRQSQNVLAFLEGSDPVLKNEIIVIGAHYDGQGRLGQADGGPRSKPKDRSDPIWNSANDNLSSVSAILSIARAIKLGGIPAKRSILFVAFGAEEHEMSGSIYYVNHPAFDLPRHVAMINLECVGRMPDKPLTYSGTLTGVFWMPALKAAGDEMGIKTEMFIPFPIPDSDHYPFTSSRIAAITLAGASDPDRHLPSDTADKIDFPRVAEAGKFACSLLVGLANQGQRPKFVQCPMPDLGMMADLATPAECDSLRLGPQEGCFRVTGIIPNRAAALAGFKVGDAMLQMNGKALAREIPLSELQKMLENILRGKMGTEIKVLVLREGKRFELNLPVTSK